MAFKFQKDNTKYKLYNLAEAMSLDDFDDESTPLTHKKAIIKDIDFIDIFISNRILRDNDSPLGELDKLAIETLSNNPDQNIGKLKVSDTLQLIEIMQRAIKLLGMTANFNWIDTTNVTKMLGLFSKILGNTRSEFNGDISKWNTINVTNMLQAFDGCHALKCNISNWDVSNVKFWDSGVYKDTNSEFVQYCKILENKIKKSPKYALRSLR